MYIICRSFSFIAEVKIMVFASPVETKIHSLVLKTKESFSYFLPFCGKRHVSMAVLENHTQL